MKQWTKDEEEFLKICIENSWIFKDIANELDRGLGSIKHKAMELKIKAKSKCKTTQQYMQELPKDIEVVDEYINNYTKIEHKHSCGYIWKTKPITILRGHSCPACNTGFNPLLVGYAYCIYFKELDLYKVGITNNLKTRLNRFGYAPEIIFTRKFDSGLEAVIIEKEWLANITKYKLNTGLLVSGNTETFKIYGE